MSEDTYHIPPIFRDPKEAHHNDGATKPTQPPITTPTDAMPPIPNGGQKKKILSLLASAWETGEGVSNITLNEFVCFRYSAVIFKLREDGWEIETDQTYGDYPKVSFRLTDSRQARYIRRCL